LETLSTETVTALLSGNGFIFGGSGGVNSLLFSKNDCGGSVGGVFVAVIPL
jgi:hypothetical protein